VAEQEEWCSFNFIIFVLIAVTVTSKAKQEEWC
jgi:hypothetical protein